MTSQKEKLKAPKKEQLKAPKKEQLKATKKEQLKATKKEQLKASNQEQPKPLNNRVFGLIFSGIFCVIAFFPMLFGGGYRQWALIVAAAWAIPALLFPAVLAPLNRLWAKFGQVMHKIINPILMGLIFFVTVVPTALILKLLGKDPMRRKFDTQVDTYWISREENSLTKESFDNQF